MKKRCRAMLSLILAFLLVFSAVPVTYLEAYEALTSPEEIIGAEISSEDLDVALVNKEFIETEEKLPSEEIYISTVSDSSLEIVDNPKEKTEEISNNFSEKITQGIDEEETYERTIEEVQDDMLSEEEYRITVSGNKLKDFEEKEVEIELPSDSFENKEEYPGTVSGSSLDNEEIKENSIPDVEVQSNYFAEGTIANNKEGINWNIDWMGKLTITGSGEIPSSDSTTTSWKKMPWYEHAQYITSAVVELSEIEDLSYLFAYCGNLTEVDLKDLNTDKTTNMEYMFFACNNLNKLDLSEINTSKVTNMECMFAMCNTLPALDLSNFNTEKVTNMKRMFGNCEKVSKLDLSNFDTEQVTDMSEIFASCYSVTSLNISSFNTSQVINMADMFRGCEKLTKLDVSHFDTGNVVNMESIFNGCKSLTSLNLDNFNTSQVNDMSFMFSECSGLKNIQINQLNTSQVTTMKYMFYNCKNLETLNISNFDTGKVRDMYGMFESCKKLKTLDISNFNTGQVNDMYAMFQDCSSLRLLDLSNFDTSNVTRMSRMFAGCSNLVELNLNGWSISPWISDMSSMLSGCSKLERIYVPYNISEDSSNVDVSLPDVFYDYDGNSYVQLPKGLTESIFLQKSTVPKRPQYPLKSISLNFSRVDMKVNEEKILAVSYTPENTTDSKEVTWSSSNPNVASVLDGTVTAVGQGSTVITANVGKYTSTCMVIVSPQITKCTITPETKNIIAGETEYLYINLEPEGYFPYDKITIENKNPENLSVKDKTHYGYLEVTGKKAGSAELILQVDGQECKATILVKEPTVQLKDSDGSNLNTITATIGEPLYNLLPPDRENYVFAGWFLQVDEQGNGIGEEITSQTIFTNQEVLYATWHALEEDQIWIKEIPQQIYTGAAIKPIVEVYKGKELLVSGRDYTVSYKNNTNVYEGNDDKKKPQVIVTGKGNYGQKVTKYFEILPKDLNAMGITIDEGLLIKAATKKVQKLVPTIKDGKKTLRSKTDFILTYPMESAEGAYQKAGQYRIIVTGKGNYKGTRTLQMRLVGDEATLITKASVKNVVTKPYSGNAIQQEPVITVGKTTLIKGQDYKLLYDNNVEIGTATMQIVGCGAYAGTKTVTFKITGTAISKAFIASGLENREYSGEEHRPQPVILKSKTSNQALVAGKDYLLSYSKNKEVGTANITITGIGAYTGTIKKSFKITAYDVKNTDISVEGEEALTVEYAVGGCNPKPTVKFKGEPLQQGVDYTVSYKNNTKLANNDAAKAPTLVITGKKNFKGSKTIFFSIVPASFDHLTLSAADIVEPKKADKWKTTLSVTNSNGKKLKAGTDYEKELIYSYAEDALMKDGTTKVKGTIVEKGDIPVAGSIIKVQIRSTGINYKANEVASTTYRIVDSTKNISKGTFKINDEYYTGREITLEERDFTKAEINKLPLLYGTDYVIVEGSYKNNIKKGTASVTIRGINSYYGTKTVSFKITPKNLIEDN